MSLRAGPSAFGHDVPMVWSGSLRRRGVSYDQLPQLLARQAQRIGGLMAMKVAAERLGLSQS